MARSNYAFQTVRTEGALLPPDLLSRITTGDTEALKPEDYDLPSGVKLNEAISQSWARMQKYWQDFQKERQSLPENQPGTELTNQKWLLPLFRELGYGKLTTSPSPEIDGKTYAITRFSWVPKNETTIVANSSLPPKGGGEPAIICMGGVLATAVHDATGATVTQLPMTRERVKTALQNRRT